MKNYFITMSVALFIFLMMPLQSSAQIGKGGTPVSFKKNLKKIPPFIEHPSFDEERMLEEDLENERNGMTPYRFAHVFEVDYSLRNSGVWEELPNGDKIWRLAVRSKGAYSLNISFGEFFIPPNASVFIYNEDKSVVLGAFSDEFNQDDDLIAMSPVPGDQLIVEYYLPAKSEFDGILKMARIGHDYRDILGTTDRANEKSGFCNIDVNCTAGSGWQTTKRAVCRILINNSGLCTGTLINNTAQNDKPYFLTANHCYSSVSAGSSTNSVFLFNYEKPGCNSGTAPTNQTVSGATVRAKSSTSDFCLLELNSAPSSSYGAALAGWNRSASTPFGSTTGIHHPGGDVKKICVENQALTTTTYLSNTASSTGTHWRVADWDLGVTEGGSSGSAIFDANQRIIGQLHGGYAACSGAVDNGQPDWYGKFSKSWDYHSASSQQLKAWLDPTNSGTSALPGKTFGNPAVCTTDAYETNNSFSQRKYIGYASANVNNLCITSGDNDYFYFYSNGAYYTVRVRGYSTGSVGQYRLSVTTSGSAITIETHPVNGSTTDTYLYLYNNNQTQLATNDDSGIGLFSKITYASCDLTTSASYIPVAAAANTASVGVTSGGSWTATESVSWMTLSPNSGSGNGNISFTCTANTLLTSRSAYITVTCGGTIRSVLVTQAGTSDCGSDSYETNNSFGQRRYIGSSTSISVTNLCITSGDNDYFYFYANGQYYNIRVRGYSSASIGQYRLSVTRSGSTVTIQTHPINGAATDTYLYLYTNSYAQLAYNDDGGTGLFSKIVYTIPGFNFSAEGQADLDKAAPRENPGNVTIYPNPASDSFTITFDENQETSNVAIFNIAGKQVKAFSINGGKTKTVDISDLPAGVFMMKIQTKEGFIIKKIMVE